jgi:hypothetical protein
MSTATTGDERLGGFAEHWCETVAYPAYNTAARRSRNPATDPRTFMREFMKADDAIPFVADDTDDWTARRLGDYLHRLARENLLPAPGDLNYPYTG